MTSLKAFKEKISFFVQTLIWWYIILLNE
jgi:hypothetical protein